jgi:hypothetical protein
VTGFRNKPHNNNEKKETERKTSELMEGSDTEIFITGLNGPRNKKADKHDDDDDDNNNNDDDDDNGVDNNNDADDDDDDNNDDDDDNDDNNNDDELIQSIKNFTGCML